MQARLSVAAGNVYLLTAGITIWNAPRYKRAQTESFVKKRSCLFLMESFSNVNSFSGIQHVSVMMSECKRDHNWAEQQS